MEVKYKILFICLGNICRSPAAEGVLRHKVRVLGRENEFIIDSAGTYGGHSGSMPDARMRLHAERRGYILDSRSREFYPTADFSNFDMVIGMDAQNVADLKRLAINDDERGKIYRMTDFCRRYKGQTEVPDPYYTGSDGFELVLDLLEDATDGLLDALSKKVGK